MTKSKMKMEKAGCTQRQEAGVKTGIELKFQICFEDR